MNDQDNHQNNHQSSHQNGRQHNHPHRHCDREGKKATVVIPDYNDLSFMEPCFRALELQICGDFEMLMVDNGSADGNVRWLKDQGVASIFLGSNTDFSGVVSRGIRTVSTPYVILLNSGTEPDCHYVGEVIKAIERPPRIFSVNSKMIQIYHKELMDNTGDMYGLLGRTFQRGVGRSSVGYNKACHVFSACVGAAIYRRKVFDGIGYFDGMRFAYLEDTDMGYRARIAGYDNIYCPSAVVYHVGSGTSGSKYNSFKVKLATCNNVYLNYKNIPALQLAVNLLPIMAGTAVKYMLSRKIGFVKDYVEGLREGITTAGTRRKVPYDPRHLRNHFTIEWELLTGILICLHEFVTRQIMEL